MNATDSSAMHWSPVGAAVARPQFHVLSEVIERNLLPRVSLARA